MSLFDPRRAWFQASSTALAVMLTVFLCGRELAWAEGAQKAASKRLAPALQHLRLPEERVTRPAEFRERRKAEAALRRAQALKALEKVTGAGRQNRRAADARAAADRLLQSSDAMHRLARGEALPVKERAAFNSARARESRRPEPSPNFVPARIAPVSPQLPSPRQSSETGALTPELTKLYASVVGEGAAVLGEHDAPVPVEYLLWNVRPGGRLASAFSDTGLFTITAGALNAPGSDDLAETPETRQTAELLTLAASFDGSPVAAFNYVHTKIAPELYYGVKKGAAQTLAEGSGNDFDQAALLVALYRAMGIPARFEYGVTLLSEGQACALTGAPNASAAATLLSLTAPAQLHPDGKHVYMERAWVRAWIGYGNYRGSGPGGEQLWVRLDPGIKRVSWSSAVDVSGLVQFDYAGFLSKVQDRLPVERYEADLLAAAKAKNLCNSLDDALSTPTVANDALRLLPGEHPAKVIQSLLVFARPPMQFRHSVTLSLDGASTTFELPELEGHELAIDFPGATPSDEATIAAAGGIENVAPYKVQVAPRLLMDGKEIDRFAPLTPGTAQSLVIHVSVPGSSPVVVTHRLTSGSSYAVMIEGGLTTQAQLSALETRATQTSGAAQDLAHSEWALRLYSHEVESSIRRLFAFEQHAAVKDVLVGVAGRQLRVQEQLGVPVALARGGFAIDISRESLTPLPRDGSPSRVSELVKLAGYQGSALEHQVWERILSAHSISSVKALQVAAEQGVPVYELVSVGSPDRAKLSGHSQVALDDIDRALKAGWTVTVPERPLNYLSYQNVEGYILLNPVNGTGAFMIGSLLNGGESNGQDVASAPGDDKPACSCSNQRGNSVIDMANGNIRETWTDLTLPGIGLPVVWSRTYASRAAGMTELGYGWMHPFGVHLRSEVDGSLTYVTEDWREVRFRKSGTTWSCAPGWHFTLTELPGGERKLRTKFGLEQTFDADGLLIQIAEPSGNTLQVIRQNGRIQTVKDSNGAVALSFAYSGNKISSVTDRAGRTVQYAHQADDLVSATDPLGGSESYGYDGAHNLTQRTDERGGIWKHFYDLQDRWIGASDPLGQQTHAAFDAVMRSSVYVDRTGAAWQRTHDANGSPLTLTDPLGNKTELQWDSDFNKTQEKDARGYVTSLEYDARGNLTKRTDPDGRIARMTYNSSFSRALKISETNLPSITNTYDSKGRLLTRTDGLGQTTYGYDGRGQLQTITQPGSAITSFTYDSDGNAQTVTDPEGGTTTLGYDGAGHLTAVTDANGHARTLQVDALGRTTSMTDAMGNVTTFGYDTAGNRISTKDAAGFVTTYVYDAAGRLTEAHDAKGGVTKTEYDGEGRVVASVDARGFRTEQTYDAGGRLASVKAADGGERTLGYCADVSTAPCAEVDPVGSLTTRTFDEMGRMTQEVDGLGRLTKRAFDGAGRLETLSGPMQPATTYVYSSNGLLGLMKTSLLSISYGYDARGNRTLVRANGQETHYTYDKANRLLTETNPLGVTTTFAYDPAGNRATRLDGNGNLTTYVYNPNRQLAEVLFADGTKYEYGYDARGLRTQEKSPTHERLLGYDELGRVAQVTDVTFGKALVYGYDPTGNRTSLSEGGATFTYAYDAVGRLKQAVDASGNAVAFAYDAAGRRTDVVRPNGIRTSYEYDAAGQVLDIVHAKAGQVLLGFSYEYDANGLRISKTREDGSREDYVYDSDMRLTQVTYPDGRRVVYTLDGLGNRKLLQESTGGANPRRESYQYNNFNQLISLSRTIPSPTVNTSFSYDGSGNLLAETTGAAVKSYVWDLDNRLREVTLATGQISTFEYDANGLRTKKVEAGITTKYLLDGPSVVAELDSLNATTTQYLTNPQVIDEILSFEQGGAAYYPLTDALGSVVSMADSIGALVRANVFDVYGERISSVGNGPGIGYGFAGREHDATGLIYHRERYVNPFLGRWALPDPWGNVDGPSLYAFARGNPVQYRDVGGTVAGLAVVNAVANFAFDQAFGAAVMYLSLAECMGDDPDLEPARAVAYVEAGFLLSLAVTAAAVAGRSSPEMKAWSRGSPETGGFARGISAREVEEINRGFGGSTNMLGNPSSALASAARHEGFWRKTAATIRAIAGGHMFDNGNKRTAQAVLELLKARNGVVTGVSAAETRRIVARIAVGELDDVDEIARLLRGF